MQPKRPERRRKLLSGVLNKNPVWVRRSSVTEVKPQAGPPGGALLSRGGEMRISGAPESEIGRVLPETEAGGRMRGDGKNE